jgi:hypothetical protein
MTLDEALAEIRSFWTDGPIPFAGGGNDHVTRLAGEFGMALPREAQQYVRFVLPPRSYAFHSVGNPIEVCHRVELSRRENASPVLQAMHGAGDWEFAPVADSIDRGPASRSFPYVRKWAPAYYDDWVGAFDNS